MGIHFWVFLFPGFAAWYLRVTHSALWWIISLFPSNFQLTRKTWNWFFRISDVPCILHSYFYLAITKWLTGEAKNIFLAFNKIPEEMWDVRARSDGITIPCTVHSAVYTLPPAVQCTVHWLYMEPMENTELLVVVWPGQCHHLPLGHYYLVIRQYFQTCRCSRAILLTIKNIKVSKDTLIKNNWLLLIFLLVERKFLLMKCHFK